MMMTMLFGVQHDATGVPWSHQDTMAGEYGA